MKKRVGGVLIYIKSNITAYVFEAITKDNIDAVENLIVKCTFNNINNFICGLYHPLESLYLESRLISHIAPSHNNIKRSIHTYRRRHPNQHEACLDYLSSSSFNLTYDNITESVDFFYTTFKSIFNKFHPLKQ